MPITLRPTETRVKESEETKVFYKIPTSFDKMKLISDVIITEKENNERGKIDNHKYIVSILEESIFNWENLINEKGEQIPFNRNLIKYLPIDLLMDIFIDIENYYKEVESQKKT